MSYEQILDEAIGDAPRSRIDVDAVVTRQRKLIRRKRITAFAGGTLVFFVAVGAIANWPFGPLTRASDPAASTTTGIAKEPAPTLAGAMPTESPSAAKLRLAAAMPQTVLAVEPGAVVPGPVTFEFLVGSAVPSPDSWIAPRYVFQGQQTVTVNGRPGVLTISVMRRLLVDHCQPDVADLMSCTQSSGPHGEGVVVEELVNTVSEPVGGRRTIVRVDRASGENIWVTLAFTGAEPLTADQLTMIALNPALTLYPLL